MKQRYLGVFLIIIGFATPFVLRKIYPTFLYGPVPSTLCFWAGFLTMFRPFDNNDRLNPYLSWARYAILVNIALTILLVGYFYLIFYFDLRHSIGFHIMRIFSFVTNPIRTIFDIIVAKPTMQQADGSVLITTTFIRTLLTDFFNLIFYSFAGMFIKAIKEKKITSVFTTDVVWPRRWNGVKCKK